MNGSCIPHCVTSVPVTPAPFTNTRQAFRAILGRPSVRWMHGDRGFAWCRTGANAAGKHGIAATMSGNRFACVGQLAGGTDSLDQEEIAVFWDGENLRFPKVL